MTIIDICAILSTLNLNYLFERTRVEVIATNSIFILSFEVFIVSLELFILSFEVQLRW